MSDDLRNLGVVVEAAASGERLLRVTHEDRDRGIEWLRSVLVAFGHTARIEGESLRLPSARPEDVERAVRTALAPEAILFDLDGVLADIGGRRTIANTEDVKAIAAEYPIGVVTTCPRRLAESVLEGHGFAEFVSVVVGSEDGPCKPDPFPVRHALQQLGKQSAWMLGDNPSDVTAARGAGAVPFAILPRGICAEAHMDRLRAAGAVRLVEGVGSLRQQLPRS